MTRRWMSLLLGLALSACAHSATSDTAARIPPAQPTGPLQKVQWRALVAAGDDSISVFDNAVDAMTRMLAADGISRIDRFTSDPSLVGKNRMIATEDSMAAALAAVPPGPPKACLVFLTSHGARDGLLLRDDLDHDRRLDPSALGRMLDQGCGSVPTVAIVSGCYSGIFIGRATEAPNRIILTAARDDRTSFGCSAEERFTYFDDCLFQSWPKSGTFAALYRAIDACVRTKENELGMSPHSEPQASFGNQVANLALP
ncbi:C13 family peptidase [Dongia sedimenti]|uniref:C13 family peptidase n=1 Tax=Dongia sedimenti TaxID=3064282 RepID=A0ABU0YG23_9PROT|nr:C13 family peptidase [Rhodospirillaceae bacterium R-7]